MYGLTMVQNFLEHSNNCAPNMEFIYIVLTAKKKSVFAERNISYLKTIIHRYLEEKWTYSYIDQLDQFVKTINSRVNRVTKIAPKKFTKKRCVIGSTNKFNSEAQILHWRLCESS